MSNVTENNKSAISHDWVEMHYTLHVILPNIYATIWFTLFISFQFGQVHTVMLKLIPNIESPDISRLNKHNVAMDPFTKFN